MPKYKALKRIFGKKKKPQKSKPTIQLVNISVAETSKRSSRRPSTSGRRSTVIMADVGAISAGGGPRTPTIVCDLGSACTRIGFASHRLPTVDTPSWVGRLPDGNKFFASGEEAKRVRNISSVFQPINRGRLTDLDAVSYLLDDGFRRIGALTAEAEDLSGSNLLLALRPLEGKRTYETLFQTLMETYRPNGCHFAFQQPLALYACSRLTGLVVDSGEGVTHAVPVFLGHAVRGAWETVKVGGDDVTDALASCLAERWDFRVRSPFDRDALDRLKEELTLLSPTPGRSPADHAVEQFQLPDGRDALLGDERYACAESLFNPHLIGRSGVGMATAVTLALKRLPAIEQKEMAKNIFPVGGSSMLKGFDRRLQAEMERKYAGNAVVRRVSSAARQTAVWRGGAAWARAPGFPDMLVTPAEYAEEGVRAFRQKCCVQITL